ncbi:MAG: hypothetical protein ACN6O2_13105 [Stenotrophomonas sp.]
MDVVDLPAPTPAPTEDDANQLRLLSIFHYVVAGMTGLFSLFPLLHLVMGIAMVTGALPMESNPPGSSNGEERMFGWIFIIFAGVFILFGLTLAGLIAYAGRCLMQRRRYLLCLVVAAISCMLMPFGTVLGVFTLVVLMRPSVKAAFA